MASSMGWLVHPLAKFLGKVGDGALGAALIGCMTFIAGCGGADSTRISGGGRVTLGGEPVKIASISFQPKQGRGVSALTEVKDGVYAFTRENGPAAGPQRVIVEILEIMLEDKLRGLQSKAAAKRSGEGRWVLEYDVPPAGAFRKDFALDATGRGSGGP